MTRDKLNTIFILHKRIIGHNDINARKKLERILSSECGYPLTHEDVWNGKTEGAIATSIEAQWLMVWDSILT